MLIDHHIWVRIIHIVHLGVLLELDLSFNNYSIQLRFEMDLKNAITKDLKIYLDNMNIPNDYKTEVIKYGDKKIISIKYSPFLEVFNSNFRENLELDEYNMIDKTLMLKFHERRKVYTICVNFTIYTKIKIEDINYVKICRYKKAKQERKENLFNNYLQ